MEWLLAECKKQERELIEMRRALHRIPEIGNDLPLTQAYVCERLDSFGIPYRKNKNDSGVIVDIMGEGSGRTLAFRADMDGLHIVEETPIAFRSEIPDTMHGCGHDAHTAILLSVAKILFANRHRFGGCVRLLFQTGEETGTGAKRMLENGAIDGVDAICAIHVGNLTGDGRKAGELSFLSGPVSAGKNKFTITVHGVGTHSAFPEKGVDPILVAARIVNGCEELMAREIPAGSAAVLSFGSLQAGLDHNTIPEKAVIKGSIRCQNEELRDFLGARLTEIATHIAAAYRATAEVDLRKGSSTVMNDASLATLAYGAVKKALGEDGVNRTVDTALMGSDDFANYACRIPGLYFFLSTNNPEKGITEPNHSPRFDVDEEVLVRGVAASVAIAIEYLNA